REPIATRCSGCSRPCGRHADAAGGGAGFRCPRRDRFAPVVRSAERTSAGGPAPGPIVRPRVCILQPQRNRVKLLVWERDGFWLLYKRLEAGTFAALERDEINARELYLLLEGIEVVRERRRYTRLPIGM